MINYLVEKLNIPKHFLPQYGVVPIELSGNTLFLAMTKPFNIMAIDDFSAVTGLRIEPVAFEPDKINELLREYERKAHLGVSSVTVKPEGSPAENAQAGSLFKNALVTQVEPAEYFSVSESSSNIITIDKPAPQVLNDPANGSAPEILEYILYFAATDKASDIHIEPQEKHVRVRQRLDGMLREMQIFPLAIKLSLISRIKILSQLDIAEKRLPQDGRIPIMVNGQHIDLRISTIPTITGEKCVLRFLYKDHKVIDLNGLGFTEYNLDRFHRIIRKPHGMVLLTGPTGSGKTTTMYAALTEISTVEKNAITIEDPVEYSLTGVNQIQVNPVAGLTFAAGLRSILRQDPDIIMVGEIRDQETAEIAVRAATTGHLVLSTMHTKDSSGAVIRLIDMGIEPYLVASSVSGVLAQRLVRLLCPQCRVKYELHLSEQEKHMWGIEDKDAVVLFRESGCESCNFTGYRGRTCISEVLPLSRSIKKLINRQYSEDDVREQGLREGMLTLMKDGINKALQGLTSIEEIMRVCFEEE
jgi:type IV pilus assembly protein PilB